MSKQSTYAAIATITVAAFVAAAPAHAAEAVTPAASPAAVTYTSASASSGRPSVLSRAEVLADLQVWKASGMAEQQHGYTTISDARYQQALARYTAMRNSPDFSTRVQSIAADRGELAGGTTKDTIQTVR